MRKYTAYQTILYSRAMNLFPKQAHRTICVNLTENVNKKAIPSLFTSTRQIIEEIAVTE